MGWTSIGIPQTKHHIQPDICRETAEKKKNSELGKVMNVTDRMHQFVEQNPGYFNYKGMPQYNCFAKRTL